MTPPVERPPKPQASWHAYPKELDAFLTPCGPCAFCGGPDARHRLVESIRDQVRAGISVPSVADDFTMAPEAIDYIASLPDAWRVDAPEPWTHPKARML